MDNNNGFNTGENNSERNNDFHNDNYKNNAYNDSSYHYTADNIRQDSNGGYGFNQSHNNSQGGNDSAKSSNPKEQGNYTWNFDDYQGMGKPPKKKKNTGVVVFCSILACFLLVGVVTLSGYGIYALYENSKDSKAETPISQEVTENSIELKDKPKDLSGVPVYTNNGLPTVEIARKVTPCVVGITQYTDYSSFTPSGYGSGIIISADGFIVTNAHVVNGAIALNVETAGGETYTAKVIGIDTRSDLAVIKVEAQNLPVAEFGNSDELEVGETVVAIGNPGSSVLAGSVTQGIVSGINRTIKEGGYSINYIQVDAAINPGNSGGALVNSFGQVIGINTAKIAAVDYEGIGFSIPIKEAKPIIDDLKFFGYVSGRTKIGISGKEVPSVLADINGYPTGVMIYTIETTSDLANTKAAQGDIITHMDGVRIETFDDIAGILQTKKAGERIKLSLFRPQRGASGTSFEVTCALMADVDQNKMPQQ